MLVPSVWENYKECAIEHSLTATDRQLVHSCPYRHITRLSLLNFKSSMWETSFLKAAGANMVSVRTGSGPIWMKNAGRIYKAVSLNKDTFNTVIRHSLKSFMLRQHSSLSVEECL